MSSSDDILPRPRTHLYLITPPQIADFPPFLSALEAVLQTSMVTALQLRLKKDGDDHPDLEAMAELAKAVLPAARDTETALIINDSVEIAAAVGADGVHLGQKDGSLKTAREQLGPEAIVGATCHNSRHLAMQAGEAGADYVAFGAFYPTATKEASTRAEPELLSWWQEVMELPCVAIGGITLDNVAGLVRAGADFIAVSAAIWQHKDGPVAAVKAFDKVLEAEHAANNA